MVFVLADRLDVERKSESDIQRYLDDCAFHEVMELLLLPLVNCAQGRYTTEADIERCKHKIIMKLHNIFLSED